MNGRGVAMIRQTPNGPLRVHNDMPFRWPTPARPIGCPGVGHLRGVFGVFSYYQLVQLFINMVCLTMAATLNGRASNH
jgi:hypothetical protein